MILNDKQLITINGGAISATYLNAIARAATVLLELGRTIGSAIRRGFSKNYC
ncbi:MAG: hypothetical protein IJ574_05265 [Bacilli bacterium]|nr:hypothetical protein [Bacilli bacterium]